MTGVVPSLSAAVRRGNARRFSWRAACYRPLQTPLRFSRYCASTPALLQPWRGARFASPLLTRTSRVFGAVGYS